MRLVNAVLMAVLVGNLNAASAQTNGGAAAPAAPAASDATPAPDATTGGGTAANSNSGAAPGELNPGSSDVAKNNAKITANMTVTPVLYDPMHDSGLISPQIEKSYKQPIIGGGGFPINGKVNNAETTLVAGPGKPGNPWYNGNYYGALSKTSGIPLPQPPTRVTGGNIGESSEPDQSESSTSEDAFLEERSRSKRKGAPELIYQPWEGKTVNGKNTQVGAQPFMFGQPGGNAPVVSAIDERASAFDDHDDVDTNLTPMNGGIAADGEGGMEQILKALLKKDPKKAHHKKSHKPRVKIVKSLSGTSSLSSSSSGSNTVSNEVIKTIDNLIKKYKNHQKKEKLLKRLQKKLRSRKKQSKHHSMLEHGSEADATTEEETGDNGALAAEAEEVIEQVEGNKQEEGEQEEQEESEGQEGEETQEQQQ